MSGARWGGMGAGPVGTFSGNRMTTISPQARAAFGAVRVADPRGFRNGRFDHRRRAVIVVGGGFGYGWYSNPCWNLVSTPYGWQCWPYDY